MSDRLISRKETAAFLKCSIDKIESLTKKGILTAQWQGGRIFFDLDQVRDYEAQTVSDPVHLSTRAAAKLLGVSQSRVRDLCDHRVLKTVKVFGTRHVLKSSVEELIAIRAEQKATKKEDRLSMK